MAVKFFDVTSCLMPRRGSNKTMAPSIGRCRDTTRILDLVSDMLVARMVLFLTMQGVPTGVVHRRNLLHSSCE